MNQRSSCRKYSASVIAGKRHPHRLGQQLHAIAARGDAAAEFVIVRVQIEQRREAADFREALAGERHRRAHHEFQPFELRRHERRAAERHRRPHAIHRRHHAARLASAIERGDAADARIAEFRGHLAKVIRLHAHIAIADGKKIEARLLREPRELRHFIVRAAKIRRW